MKRMIVITLLAMPAFTFAAAAPKVTFEPAAKVAYKVFIGGVLAEKNGNPTIGAVIAVERTPKPKLIPVTVIAGQKPGSIRGYGKRLATVLRAARKSAQ